MAYNSCPKFGLAIDWETSGYSLPNYAAKHQGISFGAIVFETKTFDAVDTIYHEVKFDSSKYEWSDGAEKIHGLSRAHLDANGITQEEAAAALAGLILKYWGPTEDVMLLGHRVHFDKAFTKQCTEEHGIFLNYHPTMIDSASLGIVLLEESMSDKVFEFMGLPPRGMHNSLEDIMNTLESVKKMKEYFLLGVSATI